MNSRTRRTLGLMAALLLFIVMPVTADEMPGNPECKICGGSGRVNYGKKAGKEKLLLYCSVKDAGKRCPMLIGGWEPCLNCEDLPSMQPVFDEHEQIRKQLMALSREYWNEVKQAGAPMPNTHSYISPHSIVYSDVDHMAGHGLAIANEECFIQFTSDFSLGGPESDWDKQHCQEKSRFILLASPDEFKKVLSWYYDSEYISHTSKGSGKDRYLQSGGVGFLGAWLQGKSPDGSASDERGFICTYSSSLLRDAFATEALTKGFPSWIDEGISNYYQSKLRSIVSWYTIAYGMGDRNDEEYWGRFENWKPGLAKANAVPVSKYDEKLKAWSGLIPMETVMTMNITQMPNQAIAQSWAYVSFLLGDKQPAKKAEEARVQFKEFLALVGSGTSQEDALKQVYNIEKFSALETKFRFWLKAFK